MASEKSRRVTIAIRSTEDVRDIFLTLADIEIRNLNDEFEFLVRSRLQHLKALKASGQSPQEETHVYGRLAGMSSVDKDEQIASRQEQLKRKRLGL